MKVLTICDDIPEEKIITPKARRVCPRKKNIKRKTSSDNNNFKFITIKNSTNNLNEKSLNLDKISLDEINKDFSKWSQSLEEEKCYDEISNILSGSIKDNSFDSDEKNSNKIERPNNPFFKNVEFFEEKNIDLIKESGLQYQINYNIDF